MPFPIYTTDGKVGIGVSNPDAELDVSGDVEISGTLTVAGAAVSGLSVGVFGSTPNSAGLSLAAGVLTLQPASVTQPGGVSIAAQTFNGAKTFDDGVLTNSVTSATAAPVAISSSVANGASAIAATINSSVALSTAGAKLVSILNNSVEKAYVDKDGGLVVSGVASGADAVTLTQGANIQLGSASTIRAQDAFIVACNKIFKAEEIQAGANTFKGSSGLSNTYYSNLGAGGAGSVAHIFRNDGTMATAGAKIGSFRNNNTEKTFVDKDGNVELVDVGASFILKSPDGTRWKLSVADTTGVLTAVLA